METEEKIEVSSIRMEVTRDEVAEVETEHIVRNSLGMKLTIVEETKVKMEEITFSNRLRT